MRTGLRYVRASIHSPMSICTQCCLYACNVPHAHPQTMCLHGDIHTDRHRIVIASTATRSFALCLFLARVSCRARDTVSYDNLGYARTILNACDHVHERVYTQKRTQNILIPKNIWPKYLPQKYLGKVSPRYRGRYRTGKIRPFM
jgi:hypothetical protein